MNEKDIWWAEWESRMLSFDAHSHLSFALTHASLLFQCKNRNGDEQVIRHISHLLPFHSASLSALYAFFTTKRKIKKFNYKTKTSTNHSSKFFLF